MACKSEAALEKRMEYQRQYRRRWRLNNPHYDHAAHYARYSTSQRGYREKIKQQVFAAYGNVCACCGETTPEFLCIDHVHDDGCLFRRTLSKSVHSLYLWAIKNNYPAAIQLLCFNCNCAKEFSGQCPHQKKRWKELING